MKRADGAYMTSDEKDELILHQREIIAAQRDRIHELESELEHGNPLTVLESESQHIEIKGESWEPEDMPIG